MSLDVTRDAGTLETLDMWPGHYWWSVMLRVTPHHNVTPGLKECPGSGSHQWPIRGLVRARLTNERSGMWLEECQPYIPNIISLPAIRDKTYFNKYLALVTGDKKGFLKREDGFGNYELLDNYVWCVWLSDLFCCHLFWSVSIPTVFHEK